MLAKFSRSHRPRRLQPLVLLSVVFWMLISAAFASPVETRFFDWEVPDAWTVSRDPSGLWQFIGPGPENLEILVSVGHLNASPGVYLKATEQVWQSMGVVRRLEPWLSDPPEQAWFLVKHSRVGEEQLVTIKWVRWDGPLLVVTSFQVPDVKLQTLAPQIKAWAADLKLKRPKFEVSELTDEIQSALRELEDSEEGLTDFEGARLALNTARQDWEPFFLADKPPLYRAYHEYLDARFDAAFAIVNGPELGMGEDIIKSRLKGVSNRREALRQMLEAQKP